MVKKKYLFEYTNQFSGYILSTLHSYTFLGSYLLLDGNKRTANILQKPTLNAKIQ